MKFLLSAVLLLAPSAVAFIPASMPAGPNNKANIINNNGAKTTPESRPPSALQAATMTGSRFTTIPQAAAVATPPKLAQRWRKSTKQVATLGPASSSLVMIEKLFLAGADVFRLNFSHGSQEQKLELLNIIRSVEEKYSHPIAILGDLQGPKLRVRFVTMFVAMEVENIHWVCRTV
jgi:Pyruvate kinase, barrel domain